MPILSIEFALFFLLFFLLYWSVKNVRLQNLLLLIASVAWLAYLHIWFAFAVCAYAAFIFVIAQNMAFSNGEHSRRLWLASGIIVAILLLLGLKYADFLRPLWYQISGKIVGEILLPLGLSYYVFQSVAYLGAVYKRHIPALSLPTVCLHFSFFPTVTAGPIFRAAKFKSVAGMQTGAAVQLLNPRRLRYPAVAICLILLGAAKSWVLSAQIDGFWVSPVFDNPQQYSTAALLAAIYGYTISLFFNFSGYSDLVIGIALLLGFHLPQNFAAPFYAANIRDFWNRWHISLSTWIRDYLYIPMGGSRKGFWRTQLHLLIAFSLSGIWHGNGWHFLLWGMLHGLALVVLNIKERLLGKCKRRRYMQKCLGIFLTFNFVSFAFILFPVENVGEAGDFLLSLFNNGNESSLLEYGYLLLPYIGILLYPLWVALLQRSIAVLNALPTWLWFVFIVMIFQLIMFFAPEGIPGFLYANF